MLPGVAAMQPLGFAPCLSRVRNLSNGSIPTPSLISGRLLQLLHTILLLLSLLLLRRLLLPLLVVVPPVELVAVAAAYSGSSSTQSAAAAAEAVATEIQSSR